MGRSLGYDFSRYKPLRSDPFVAQASLCPKAQIVFDIGGFVGDVAAKYAKMYPGATIISCEPFEESFRQLSETARREQGAKILPIQTAVGAVVGEVEFHINARAETNSLLPRSTGPRYFAANAGPVTTMRVRQTTVDILAAEHGPPNILKIDTQGADLLVIAGAVETLTTSPPELILCEVNFVPHYEGSALFGDVLAALGKYGYSLFGLYELCHATNGQLRFGDALFTSRHCRARLESLLRPTQSEPGRGVELG
jgi:FkbM family methyltransferase